MICFFQGSIFTPLFSQSIDLLNSKLADEEVYDLYEPIAGELLLMTSRGLVHVKRRNSIQLDVRRYYEGFQFWEAYEDSTGGLWLIGNNPYLIRFTHSGVSKVSVVNSDGQFPFGSFGPGVVSGPVGELYLPTVTGNLSLLGDRKDFFESIRFLSEKARLLHLNDTIVVAPLYIFNKKDSSILQFADAPPRTSRNYVMFQSLEGIYVTHTFHPNEVWFISRETADPQSISLRVIPELKDGLIFLGHFYNRLWFRSSNSLLWFDMHGEFGGKYHLPFRFQPTKLVPSLGGGLWVLSLNHGIQHISLTELRGDQYTGEGVLSTEINLLNGLGAVTHDRESKEVAVFRGNQRTKKFNYKQELPKLWESEVVYLFNQVFIASEEWLLLGDGGATTSYESLRVNPRYIETKDSIGVMLTYKGTFGLTLCPNGTISSYKISPNTFSKASLGGNGIFLSNNSGLWFSEQSGTKFLPAERLSEEPVNFMGSLNGVTFFQMKGGGCFVSNGKELVNLNIRLGEVVKCFGYSKRIRGYYVITSNTIYRLKRINKNVLVREESSFLASISGIVKDATIVDDEVFLIRQNHRGESLWSFSLEDLFIAVKGESHTTNLEREYIIPEENPVLNLSLGTNAMLTMDSVHFMWRLDGVSSEWKSFDGSSIDFSGFKPGSFRISVVQHFARHEIDKDSFIVHITRPFYRTPAFWVISLSLFIMILTLLLVWKIKSYAIKAQLELRLMQLDRKVFGSRLNAHFVFNTLNNLKGLVESRRAEEASFYLTKFSKVLRSFLEQTFSDGTPVSKEVHFLLDYLSLEHMRFPGAFEFTIRSEEDVLELEFPSGIVQPFVENCFKHAILKRPNGGGHIDIVFYRSDSNGVCVEISDNGPDNNSQPKKESDFSGRGLQIIKEHLELLRKLKRWDVHFQTEFCCTGSKITILAKKM